MDITIKRQAGAWWIIDRSDPEPIGPYTTKAEAEDDARGLVRFAKYGHLRSYVFSGGGK